MTDDPTEHFEGEGGLREMTMLAAEIGGITSAKEDGRLSDEQVADLRSEVVDALPIDGHFPGDRDRAMGHALALVEKLEEVDISAEREYLGPAEWADGGVHEIRIQLTGDDGNSTERGGA